MGLVEEGSGLLLLECVGLVSGRVDKVSRVLWSSIWIDLSKDALVGVVVLLWVLYQLDFEFTLGCHKPFYSGTKKKSLYWKACFRHTLQLHLA